MATPKLGLARDSFHGKADAPPALGVGSVGTTT